MLSGNALRRVYGCAVGRPRAQQASCAFSSDGASLRDIAAISRRDNERRSPSGASENDQQR
eukprot:2478751-Prymnesium_polylepis.1